MARYTNRKQYIDKLLSYKDKDLINRIIGDKFEPDDCLWEPVRTFYYWICGAMVAVPAMHPFLK